MDLNIFRNKINEIDEQIIELFVERMRITANIAEAKAAQNLPILDSSREKAVLQYVKKKAGKEFEGYAETLYQTVFNVSKSYQSGLMATKPSPSRKITAGNYGQKKHINLLVLNGPNINMLGIREKNIYGNETYDALLQLLEKTFQEIGVKGEVFQSNSESALVERIQAAYSDQTDGIIINPAAYTHTSIAILDALKAVSLPAVEVHISNVVEREAFRQISYTGMACIKTIAGKGFYGYVEAVRFLADYIASRQIKQ